VYVANQVSLLIAVRFVVVAVKVAMDHNDFSASDGEVTSILQSDCEGSGSDASSDDVEVVGAGVCRQVLVAAGHDVNQDRLFRSRSRRSLFLATSVGTSVFSDRTRRRWEHHL
jgi:hypothetical protein